MSLSAADALVSAVTQSDSLATIDQQSFKHIAEYLPLEEKRLTLAQLDHAIASRLSSECYRTDEIALRVGPGIYGDRTSGLLPFVPLVRGVSCQLDDWNARDGINIIDALIVALRGSWLKTLHLGECLEQQHSPLAFLLDRIEEATVTNTALHSLTVQVWSEEDEWIFNNGSETHYSRLRWRSFSAFSSLQSLSLKECERFPFPGWTIPQWAGALPPTLTHIDFPAAMNTSQLDGLVAAFRRTSFLPCLQSLEISDEFSIAYESELEGQLIEPLSTTLIESGTIRPIRALKTFVAVDHIPLLPSFELLERLELWHHHGSLKGLTLLPSSALSNLTRFVSIHNESDEDEDEGEDEQEDDDFASIIDFASARPVTHLQARSDTATLSLLNYQIVRSLGSRRALTVLKLDYQVRARQAGEEERGDHSDDVIDAAIVHLPPGCWAQLEELQWNFRVTETALIALLRAAPNLTSLDLGYTSEVVDVRSLPLINRHCRQLRSLCLNKPPGAVSPLTAFGASSCLLTVRRFQQLLAEHTVLGQLFFPHLTNLDVPAPMDNVTHCLFAALQSAPLARVKLVPGPESCFAAFLQSALPQLRTPRMAWPGQPYDLLYCRQPNGFAYHFLTIDDPFARHEPEFRRQIVEIDENGEERDGREAFFDALYRQLSEEEKQRLEAWGSGDYEWKPSKPPQLRRSKRLRISDSTAAASESAIASKAAVKSSKRARRSAR